MGPLPVTLALCRGRLWLHWSVKASLRRDIWIGFQGDLASSKDSDGITACHRYAGRDSLGKVAGNEVKGQEHDVGISGGVDNPQRVVAEGAVDFILCQWKVLRRGTS